MGHNRLGRLPRTRRWREVVELLDTGPAASGVVADAVVTAAEVRLRGLANDPALAESIRILSRITFAARSDDFVAEMTSVGVALSSDASAMSAIAAIGDAVRSRLGATAASPYFTEIAALALRTALAETVGEQGRSLFGSSVQDLQSAFRGYSTRDGFAGLARRFFARFLSGAMRSFVDRELANHVGGRSALRSVSESSEFMAALDTHTWQAARIVEDFAGGWHSKKNWETGGDVSLEDAQRFVGVALRKLRSEIHAGARA